jgi:ribonuclease P protein component
MPKQFTLQKKERLKSRKQIEHLFRAGKNFLLPPYRVYYSIHNEEQGLQFGTGVSGKNFKKAVDRNRIKRLTREAWRLQKNELNKKLIAVNKQMNVFFIYTGKELPEYKFIFEKINSAVQKLIKVIE